MEDKDIIELYWNRRESAISATSEKYHKYCYHIAVTILGNAEDAEECVSDTWEYGCDFVYADAGKDNCLQQRFFSGFVNGQGDFVSVEYAVDNVYTNEDPYVLFEGKADVSYYTTADGVEVFLTKATGTKGKTRTTAEVYTEHGHLYIGMYGTFEEREIHKILDSIHNADGMNLDQ